MDMKDKVLITSWAIDTKTKRPLYKQLATYLKSKIISGDLVQGYMFPPFRKLAEYFEVSRSIIEVCFTMLMAEGYIIQNSSRRYIVSGNIDFDNEVCIDWQYYIKRASHTIETNIAGINNNADLLKHNTVHKYFINSEEFGCRELYVDAMRKAAERIWVSYLPEDNGHPELLEQVALFLSKRGIITKPSQLLVTQNECASMYLLSVALLGSSTTLIAAKPNRFMLLTSLQAARTHISDIRRSDDGIITDDLYSKIKNSNNSVLYIEPNREYVVSPNNYEDKMKEIANMCLRMKVPIIESDCSYDYSPGHYPSITSLHHANNMIYHTNVGEFINYSGSMGIISASEHVINHLTNVYSKISLQCSNYTQAIYLELLKSGRYEKYLEELKPKLNKRIKDAEDMFAHYLTPYATWQKVISNLYLMLKFNGFVSFLKMNIDVGACKWYYSENQKNTIHISLTSCSLYELEAFVKNLAKECEKQSSASLFATD